MTITLYPKKIIRFLLFVAIFLVAFNLVGNWFRYYSLHNSWYGLIDKFDLNTEANFPTLFSGLLLGLAALLVGWIGLVTRTQGQASSRYWKALSWIFVYLAVDEMASVHEWIEGVLERLVQRSPIGSYLWTLPFSLLVLVILVIYARFWWGLPGRTRLLTLLAGLLFLGGGLGMELVSAWHTKSYGVGNFAHALIYTTEEALEMSGVILFIYAMLCYAGDLNTRLGIEIDKIWT